MSARRKPARRPHADAGSVRYVRRYLTQVGQILVECGHSPKTLKREFDRICPSLKEPKEPWDATRFDYFADLRHVITHWRHDATYTDAQGCPKPLPLRGEDPSLGALIERVLPGRDPAAVAASLVRVKGLRRRKGLYLPTAEFIAFTGRTAEAYCLDELSWMMHTVQHNISGSRSNPLLERSATNPSVPRTMFPAFHRRLEERAMRFLVPTDAELRELEESDTPGPRSRVSVGVFVYQSPTRSPPRSPSTNAPGRPRRLRGGH